MLKTVQQNPSWQLSLAQLSPSLLRIFDTVSKVVITALSQKIFELNLGIPESRKLFPSLAITFMLPSQLLLLFFREGVENTQKNFSITLANLMHFSDRYQASISHIWSKAQENLRHIWDISWKKFGQISDIRCFCIFVYNPNTFLTPQKYKPILVSMLLLSSFRLRIYLW